MPGGSSYSLNIKRGFEVYLKDKNKKVTIRLSLDDYNELKENFDLFCLSHNCDFTFSEYLRRLLLIHRNSNVKKRNVI